MSNASLVVVKTFPDRIEAELAHSALEAAGIEAMLRTDDAGGLQPGMALANGIAVLVRVEDATAAAEVLSQAPTTRKPRRSR
jgi:hypothetical protein